MCFRDARASCAALPFQTPTHQGEDMQIQGCYTALVTPFRNGEVDYPALKEIVEAQVAGGVAV